MYNSLSYYCILPKGLFVYFPLHVHVFRPRTLISIQVLFITLYTEQDFLGLGFVFLLNDLLFTFITATDFLLQQIFRSSGAHAYSCRHRARRDFFQPHSTVRRILLCWPSTNSGARGSSVVFVESRPSYPCPSTDASHASLVDPLSSLLFPYPPSAPLPISVSSSELSHVVPDNTVKPPVTQVYSRR
jgi:hypothetical protein